MINLVSDALCTYEDIQLHLELTNEQNHDDTIIDLINMYTKRFCNHCGISSFLTKTYTEYYDGNGESILFLKNVPITSVQSLADDDSYIWGIDTTVGATDFRIIQDGKAIYLIDDLFTKGFENIKVVYTAGYSQIPEDLRFAAIREVGRSFKHRKDWEAITQTLSDSSHTYIDPGLSAETTITLSFYRNNWV
jgi:hypothetical protein